MKVKKIYKSKIEESEYIFILEDGRKIIKRSEKKLNKLNIKKWDEVSFISENFSQDKRNATEKEKKKINNFLKGQNNSKNSSKSIWDKFKNIFK